jgi:hypothetical protein
VVVVVVVVAAAEEAAAASAVVVVMVVVELGSVLERYPFLSTCIPLIPIGLLADVMIVHETVQRCPVKGTLYYVIHGRLPAVLAPFNECYLHHWQNSCMIMSVNCFTLKFMLTKK